MLAIFDAINCLFFALLEKLDKIWVDNMPGCDKVNVQKYIQESNEKTCKKI